MKRKLLTVLLTVAMVMVMFAVPAFCASPAPIETVLTTELGNLGDKLLLIIGIVLAAAIPIVAAILAAKKGIGWFKGIAK